MNDYPDLIILAIIAGFVIYKLYSNLGKIDEQDLKEKATIKDAEPVENDLIDIKNEQMLEGLDQASLDILQKMVIFEPNFSLANFIAKATKAFEYILESYSKHDIKALEGLVSGDVLAIFAKHIEQLEKNKIKLNLVIVSISQARVESISEDHNNTLIKVEFESHQMEYNTNESDLVIEGSSSQIMKKTDKWTFSRPIESTSPKWILVKAEN